jgi:hypothetical protein
MIQGHNLNFNTSLNVKIPQNSHKHFIMSVPPPLLAAGSSAELQANAFGDDPRYACFLAPGL